MNYQLVKIYESRKNQAEEECRILAAKIRLNKDYTQHEVLKNTYIRYKHVIERNERLIDKAKAKLVESTLDCDPIKGIIAHFSMIRNIMEKKGKDTVEVDFILNSVREGNYQGASLCIAYFNACRDELEETSMYLHSNSWYRVKHYYLNILLK